MTGPHQLWLLSQFDRWLRGHSLPSLPPSLFSTPLSAPSPLHTGINHSLFPIDSNHSQLHLDTEFQILNPRINIAVNQVLIRRQR